MSRHAVTIFSTDPSFDKAAWAAETALALLPKGVPVFQRHRWMNSTTSVAETALIANTFNLLERTTPLWVGELKGRVAAEAPIPSWCVDSESEDEGENVAKAAVQGQKIDFAAFNRRQRRDARTFAQSKPGPGLLVLLACSQPQARLLWVVEHNAAEGFDREQMVRLIREGACSSRVREAREGKHYDEMMMEHWRLISSPHAWPMVPEKFYSQDMCSLAFALSSTACCAFVQLLFEPSRRLPKQLWAALDGPEQRAKLQAIPPCMQDPFTSAFMAKFVGSGGLASADARLVLWQLERVLRTEICAIESRNAAARRDSRKSQTWAPGFSQAPCGSPEPFSR